jgi:hypothetical protein
MPITSLLVPVVAGVFVVLGALIGAFLARSNEHRQWLRNEKLKAYQKFVETFAGAPLTNGLSIIGYDDREAAEVVAAYEDMYRVCVNVQFVAPVAIAEEINRTTEALGNLQGWVNDLPRAMYEQYVSGNLTEEEAKAANRAMTADIHAQVQNKLADFTSDSIGRVNTAAEMMRKDLRIRSRAFF